MREERIQKNLKVILSETEVLDFARKMAKAQADLMAAQNRKAELMSELNASIKKCHADVEDYSRIVGNGYVYRDVDCRVVFDHPEPNLKTIIRLDDYSEVSVERMTDQERQFSIRFSERAEENVQQAEERLVEIVSELVCSVCLGRGRVGDFPCPECNGSGKPKVDPE